MSAVKDAGKAIKDAYETLLNAGKEKGLAINHQTAEFDSLSGVVTVTVTGKSSEVDGATKKIIPNDVLGIGPFDGVSIHQTTVDQKPHGKDGDDAKLVTITHTVTTY